MGSALKPLKSYPEASGVNADGIKIIGQLGAADIGQYILSFRYKSRIYFKILKTVFKIILK